MKVKGSEIKITVIGLGGAGGNAVSRMSDNRSKNIRFLALNTDLQALSQIKNIETFAIGPETTKGMGSGGNQDIGRKAIKESQEQVAKFIDDADMVFITAGMGGGTGTGSAPIIAEMSKRMGALTIGIVTLPFSFEGEHRREIALQGIQRLSQKTDTLIQINNDRLLSIFDEDFSLDKAFERADETLIQGVKSISDIIVTPGFINIDFADMQNIISNGGAAFMSVGTGKGKTAAIDAVETVLANPLFDAPVEGATDVLLNIRGGKSLTLGQVNEIVHKIRVSSHSEPKVIFGVVKDRKYNNRVSITLIATGIKTSTAINSPRNETYRESSLLHALVQADSNGHNQISIGDTEFLSKI